MMDVKKSHTSQARVEMTWVPVRDAQGRVHMEAHWVRQDPTTRVRPAA